MSMNDENKDALQYRFSSYQLPKVDFDAGFPSYVVPVHPYFFNQPEVWTKPAYTKYDTTGPQLLQTYGSYKTYSYTSQIDISHYLLELSGNPADVATNTGEASDSRSLEDADLGAESRCSFYRETAPKNVDGSGMLPF